MALKCHASVTQSTYPDSRVFAADPNVQSISNQDINISTRLDYVHAPQIILTLPMLRLLSSIAL